MGVSVEPAASTVAIRVLLVTGVRLLREGLVRALASEPGMTVVAAVATADALGSPSAAAANVILADSSVVRSADVVAIAARSGAKVVAFAVAEEDPQEVVACAESGVAGIVGRDATLEELTAALRAAAGGDLRCSPRVAGLVMRHVAQLASQQTREGTRSGLTRRESEIAVLIHRGLSNKEIASELGIETATVKNHVHSLLAKMQVRRRGQVSAVLAGGRGGGLSVARAPRGTPPSGAGI